MSSIGGSAGDVLPDIIPNKILVAGSQFLKVSAPFTPTVQGRIVLNGGTITASGNNDALIFWVMGQV